jgi:16S rRNA (guanine966-N2)-methyltransferase
MRVIAGRYKSRKLRALRGMEMRPTSDRLRETLFNVLGKLVEDALFVDLFAGSGAVGIEALSRGARHAIFVESHAPAAALVRDNLKSLDIAGGAEVLMMDAARGLEKLAARRMVADLIFLDPPYEDAASYDNVLAFLDASRLVAPAGLVIAEHSRRMVLEGRLSRLECVRLLEQGDASLSFYRLSQAA